MVTALILQLVQCIVMIPDSNSETPQERENEDPKKSTKVLPQCKQPFHCLYMYISLNNNYYYFIQQLKMSADVSMINSYELSLKIGSTFLSTFMKKWVTVNIMYCTMLLLYPLCVCFSSLSLPLPLPLLSLLGVVLVRLKKTSGHYLTISSRTSSLPYPSQSGQPLKSSSRY